MRIILITGAVILLSFKTTKLSNDFAAVFGKDYSWAQTWIKNNAAAFDKTASQLNISAKEMEAIIFPELIRYNAVYDAMEIQSLKFLYVSQGKDYADFSVGYFQMKPSFAEHIEKDAALYLDAATLAACGLNGLDQAADNETARRERISRITSAAGQLKYLSAFYKICEAKFSKEVFANAEERTRFFATCYNAGYQLTAEKIKEKQNKKFFHTGKFIQSDNYCYADVAADWLKR